MRCCLIAGVLLIGSGATAEEDVVARATALYNEGRFDAAVSLLTRARQESTDPGQLAKISSLLGINYAVLGQTDRSRAAFREALRHDPELTLDARVVKASVVELFNALKARLCGTLEVAAARALRVVIDGRPSGVTPLSVKLPIGAHLVEVKNESGEVVHRRELVLRPDTTERLQVVLPVGTKEPPAVKKKPPEKKKAAGGKKKDTDGRPPGAGRRRRVWTWVVLGLAVTEAAAGFGLWAWGSSGFDEFENTKSPERYDELKDSLPGRYRAAQVMLGLAAGTAAAAVVLYILEGRGSAEHRSNTASLGPGGLTLQF